MKALITIEIIFIVLVTATFIGTALVDTIQDNSEEVIPTFTTIPQVLTPIPRVTAAVETATPVPTPAVPRFTPCQTVLVPFPRPLVTEVCIPRLP